MKKIFIFLPKEFEKGFTFTELLVTMFLFVTLLGLVTISLVNAKQKTELNNQIEILISDIHQQRLRSMVGDAAESSAPRTYGIHFAETSYILFSGNVYDANSPSNFSVNLGDNIKVTNAPQDLIFLRVSGEVGSNGTITLQDVVSQTTKTLEYNRYGTIVDVN